MLLVLPVFVLLTKYLLKPYVLLQSGIDVVVVILVVIDLAEVSKDIVKVIYYPLPSDELESRGVVLG